MIVAPLPVSSDTPQTPFKDWALKALYHNAFDTHVLPHELSRLRYLSCTHKRQYHNQEVAWKAASRYYRGRISGKTVVAYACQFCGAWHIGGTHIKAPQTEEPTMPPPLVQQSPGFTPSPISTKFCKETRGRIAKFLLDNDKDIRRKNMTAGEVTRHIRQNCQVFCSTADAQAFATQLGLPPYGIDKQTSTNADPLDAPADVIETRVETRNNVTVNPRPAKEESMKTTSQPLKANHTSPTPAATSAPESLDELWKRLSVINGFITEQENAVKDAQAFADEAKAALGVEEQKLTKLRDQKREISKTLRGALEE